MSQARVSSPTTNRLLVVALITAGIFVLFVVYLIVTVSSAVAPMRDVELLDLRQPANQQAISAEQARLPVSAIPIVILVDPSAGNPCTRVGQEQPTFCETLTNRAVLQINADNRDPAQVMTVLYGDSLTHGGGRYAQLWRSKSPVSHAIGRSVLLAVVFSVLLGVLFSVALWLAGQRRPARSARGDAPNRPRHDGLPRHGEHADPARADDRAAPPASAAATPVAATSAPVQRSWSPPGAAQPAEHVTPIPDSLTRHQAEQRPTARGPIPHVFHADAAEIARAAGQGGDAVARTFLDHDGGYVSLNGLLVWAAASPGVTGVAEPGDRLRVVGADPSRTTVLVSPDATG